MAHGRPPPMTLPKVERSGSMPQYFCAPPYEMRKPVITWLQCGEGEG